MALLKLERKAELKVLPDFLTSLEQCTSKNISWMGYFKSFATAGPSEQLQAADKIYPISKKACEEKFGELPDDVECAKTEDNVNPISTYHLRACLTMKYGRVSMESHNAQQ